MNKRTTFDGLKKNHGSKHPSSGGARGGYFEALKRGIDKRHTPNPSQEGNKSCSKMENFPLKRNTLYSFSLERSNTQNSPLEARAERSRNRSNTPNSPLEARAERSRNRINTHNSPLEARAERSRNRSNTHNSPLERSNTQNSPLERGRGCVKKDNHPSTNTGSR